MGIYLGQLPPAEIARLKAELAETLIANFCYPRFFDYRTDSLRMRPVDRAKRQEVWLYLSSVDFTAWSRLDLTSPDFQRQIERLFILFVQRNRSFFGVQGRKRMSDIRMLIGSSSTSVVQGLRSHVMGQRQGNTPFGSPRPVVSWSASGTSDRPELGWEQVAAATMLLQQQMQEVRGEIKPAAANDGRATNGVARRPVRGSSSFEYDASPAQPPSGRPEKPVVSGSLPRPAASGPLPGTAASATNGAAKPVPARPGTSPQLPTVSSPSTAPMQPAASTAVPPTPAMRRPEQAEIQRKAEPLEPLVGAGPARTPFASAAPAAPFVPPTPLAPVQVRGLPQPAQSLPVPTPAATSSVATPQRDNPLMLVGEDDMAIFEQMRHQLLVWLRVEAVRLGLDITGQGPSQLLELLRQQSRFDETRLQVVSTLLNLANQIIKNGQVSVIDYKQALMFYLMHTRQ